MCGGRGGSCRSPCAGGLRRTAGHSAPHGLPEGAGAPPRITAELSFDGSGGIDGVFAGGTGYLVCERNLEL